MIKSWIFTFGIGPGAFDPEPPQHSIFESLLTRLARAEAFGYEGVFFSEHHFGAPTPCPNLLVANLAARTKTMRIGVLGMVLPFYSPLRVVEEVAMLDHLTNGRLEIGTAPGIPVELLQIKLNVKEAKERYSEILDILDMSQREAVISYQGKYWQIDNLHVSPRLLQRPGPPRWTTVMSADSARRAAQRGVKICAGFLSTETVGEIFDAYREEAARLGIPAGPTQLGIRRQVDLVGNDASIEGARREMVARTTGALSQNEKLARSGVLDAPHATQTMRISDDEYLVGGPQAIADEIKRQCLDTGAGHFLCSFNEQAHADETARVQDLYGTEVIPLLASDEPMVRAEAIGNDLLVAGVGS